MLKDLVLGFICIVVSYVAVQLAIPIYLANSEGGCGTGFFVNNQGHLVTAAHVVGRNNGYLCFSDGSACGKIVGIDYDKDIAYAKFHMNTPYLVFSILPNNEEVFIRFYGYPEVDKYGYNLKVGTGLGVIRSGFVSTNIYYTRANINPGNSGGPALFRGKVVGSITNKMVVGPAGVGWGTTSYDMVMMAYKLNIPVYVVDKNQDVGPNLNSIKYVCTVR